MFRTRDKQLSPILIASGRPFIHNHHTETMAEVKKGGNKSKEKPVIGTSHADEEMIAHHREEIRHHARHRRHEDFHSHKSGLTGNLVHH
mmetsp:Transcript_17250/g.26685  ORF Transcript_17250/g.26685 Transcript_17250/m.26685 type:complete len:89 (-) Transcript_17250:86-352(-)